MTERWKLGDNGDGRQWWTIITEHGEIVAQAVLRPWAEDIIECHNNAQARPAREDERVSEIETRISGTNGQCAIYEHGRYLATCQDRQTADRIITALARPAPDDEVQVAAERLLKRHREYEDSDGGDGQPVAYFTVCAEDEADWPCDVALVARAVLARAGERERLIGSLSAYTKENVRLWFSILQPWPAGGFCCIVCQEWGKTREAVEHKACAFDHVYQEAALAGPPASGEGTGR